MPERVAQHLRVALHVSDIGLCDTFPDNVWKASGSKLHRTVGPDVLYNVIGYHEIGLRRLSLGDLHERSIASLHYVIDTEQIDLGLIPVSDGHVFVNFDDTHLGGFNDAPHVGDLRADIEISVLIHRGNLEIRDVHPVVVIDPKLRQLARHHGNVPAASRLVHLPVLGREKRRREAHLLIGMSGFEYLERLLSDSRSGDYGDILKLVCSFGQSFININYRSAPGAEVDAHAVSHISRCLVCRNEFSLVFFLQLRYFIHNFLPTKFGAKYFCAILYN